MMEMPRAITRGWEEATCVHEVAAPGRSCLLGCPAAG